MLRPGPSLLLLVLLPVLGCGKETQPESEPIGDDPLEPPPAEVVESPDGYEPPTPECVRLEYPCSYGEVDPGVLTASLELGVEAGTRLEESSTDTVAAWLAGHPDVVEVLHDERVIRYRTRGGRPLWLTKHPPGEGGTRAHPAHEPIEVPAYSLPESPLPAEGLDVGLDTNVKNSKRRNGIKPEKSYLILSPFLWEFGADETDSIRTLLTSPNSKASRDYTGPGSNVQRITTAPGAQGAPGLLSSFKGWHNYDLIHVSTHGEKLCLPLLATMMPTASPCYTAIFTGGLVVPSSGQAPTSQSGVEWFFGGTPGCAELSQLDPAWTTSGCATGRWWEAVTADFFAAQGPPLENTVIYFSACKSVVEHDLFHTLTGSGSVFLGFDIYVDNRVATDIAHRFYTGYLRYGWTAERAFAVTNSPTLVSPTFGVTTSQVAHGQMIRSGSRTLRGRDPVAALDATSQIELVDDGMVSDVIGVPNDGRPDSIRILAEVNAIEAGQNPQNFPIELQVDGAPPVTWQPQRNPTAGVWQVEATVPLGFDHAPQDRFDLEIRADLEEGGRARWRYERLRLAGCYWTVDVSGVPASGRFAGDQATFLDMGGALTLTLGGVDDERTITTVVLERAPGPGAGPQPLPLGSPPNQPGALMLHLPATGSSASLPFASGDGSPIYANSPRRVIDYEPPPLDFTVNRIDAEWVEGHAWGVVYAPRLTGSTIDKATVQVHFRARRAIDLNAMMGSSGFPTSLPDPDPCDAIG